MTALQELLLRLLLHFLHALLLLQLLLLVLLWLQVEVAKAACCRAIEASGARKAPESNRPTRELLH